MALIKRKKVTQFNPSAFRNEVAQLNPQDMADVATHWRKKAHTVQNEMAMSTENALEIGVSGATTFGLSYMAGMWDYDRDLEIAKWSAGGAAAKGLDPNNTDPFTDGDADDPSKMFGIEKTLWATIVLGGAAAFGIGSKKYNPFIRAAAVGALASWAGTVGHKMGRDVAADRVAAAPQAQANPRSYWR